MYCILNISDKYFHRCIYIYLPNQKNIFYTWVFSSFHCIISDLQWQVLFIVSTNNITKCDNEYMFNIVCYLSLFSNSTEQSDDLVP